MLAARIAAFSITKLRTLGTAAESILVVLALCAVAVPTLAQPVRASSHMVVAANPLATEAGIEILRKGGSAVDAAIAVQLVLSLVEPQSSGIGGGAFLLHYDGDATGDPITAYDGRETAPAAATPDMFLDEQGRPQSFPAVAWGGLAVGVPGVMRMLELAHEQHGRLPWSELFEPAITLAERGFPISTRLHALLDGFKRFARAPEFRAHYYDADGEALPVGHRLVNPEYAATLRALAEKGAEEMYTGELARAIVARVRENELLAGRMTLEDLARYRSRVSSPLCSDYRRWRICGPQLPSSGGITTQQILGILAQIELPDISVDPVGAIHRVAEASRLAFADRNHYLADPDFVDVPVAGLLDPAYLKERSALISPTRALQQVVPGTPAMARAARLATSPHVESHSTSHVSIVDRFGDAVSMTTSVQSTFGSQLMVGGFLLNNQLTDFTYEPEIRGLPTANRIEGGKRPLSSMSPSFVLDEQGRLSMVIGSPGGTRIIGFVVQALLGVLDWGLDIQQAVAAPHFIAQDGPVELEQGTSITAHRDGLEALGHRVVERSINSGLHGIVIEHDGAARTLYGGVDPRREGVARGD
jgi:gamma-glutamyltranspeptidase/glutathione hydrolase